MGSPPGPIIQRVRIHSEAGHILELLRIQTAKNIITKIVSKWPEHIGNIKLFTHTKEIPTTKPYGNINIPETIAKPQDSTIYYVLLKNKDLSPWIAVLRTIFQQKEGKQYIGNN